MKTPKMGKCDGKRKNANELAFERMAESKGYTFTHRGWPDYLCEKDGRYVAVEVKPRTNRGRLQYLKHEQVVVMLFLQSLGVTCCVSDGETTEGFTLKQHASVKSLKALGLFPLPDSLK